MRRRPKVQEKLEKLSVADALHAIRFAEVVVLLMDADRAFEEQDLRLADLVEREGRALVIGMSKWDLAERQPGAFAKLREEADHWLPQLKGVPVIGVSGLTGEGLDRLMEAVLAHPRGLEQARSDRALNRWLGAGDRGASAARGVGPPPQAQLHDAGEEPAAELRAVLHPRRRGARRLPALSGQRLARGVRPARHADPPDAAREGQSVRRPRQAQALTAPRPINQFINGSARGGARR